MKKKNLLCVCTLLIMSITGCGKVALPEQPVMQQQSATSQSTDTGIDKVAIVETSVSNETTDVSEDSDFVVEGTNCVDSFILKYTNAVSSEMNSEAVLYPVDWKYLVDMYNNNESGFVYASADWCPYCQILAGPLTQALANTGVSVYYIDCVDYPRTGFGDAVKDADGNVLYYPLVGLEISGDYEEFRKICLEYETIDMLTKDVKVSEDSDIEEYKYVSIPGLFYIHDNTIEEFSSGVPIADASAPLSNEDKIKLTNELINWITMCAKSE